MKDCITVKMNTVYLINLPPTRTEPAQWINLAAVNYIQLINEENKNPRLEIYFSDEVLTIEDNEDSQRATYLLNQLHQISKR